MTNTSTGSNNSTKSSNSGMLRNSKSQWAIVILLVSVFMILLSLNQKKSMGDMIGFSNDTWQQQRSTQIVVDKNRIGSTSKTQEDDDDHDEIYDSSEDSTSKDSTSNDQQPIAISNDKKSKKNKIQQITILGERNSGTRWTYDHIKECFRPDVIVSKRLSRYKHWFQHDNSSAYLHDTLVLAQFRNPYEWLKAMEHVPHHSPAHLRTSIVSDPSRLLEKPDASNDWKIFLMKPWTMDRVGLDLQLNDNATCQEFFKYKDIVSCVREPLPESSYNWTLRYSENQPFYEMRNDGSGIPYNNIMEMRSDKIRNYVNDVRRFDGVNDVLLLQYEYLVATGTKALLDRIEAITGIKPNCSPKEPQIREPRESRAIAPEFATFVRQTLNWTVEAMIGYYPELDREKSAGK